MIILLFILLFACICETLKRRIISIELSLNYQRSIRNPKLGYTLFFTKHCTVAVALVVLNVNLQDLTFDILIRVLLTRRLKP